MSRVDGAAEVEVDSALEDGVWSISIKASETTLLIETTVDDVNMLATLAGSMNQILEAAWAAIEETITNAQEAP